MQDKTSITRDDSPEGINQYTGGGNTGGSHLMTRLAERASKSAMNAANENKRGLVGRSQAARKEVSQAHSRAATAYENARQAQTDPKYIEHHTREAAYHTAQAEKWNQS